MTEERDDHSSEPGPGRPSGDERLARLAADLGLALPPFDSPLDAFALDEGSEDGHLICLGGDLHASHPGATIDRTGGRRDNSLDAARVVLDDGEHEPLEAQAVEGLWCLPVRGDYVDSAPFFALWDTEGRLRSWLLIPPARMMLGIGCFWLPSVPQPSGSIAPAPRPRRPPTS